MKKRIIIAIVIAIILSSLCLVNYLIKEPYDINEEINKCMEQNNSSYRVNKGKVYCFITNSTTTTTTKNITTTTSIVITKKSKVNKKTKKASEKIVMNINATKKEMMDYTLEQVIAKGWLKSEYEAVVSIVARESNWNPNSVNRSSGACGLFQAHPCNKAIKDYPDYMTNWKSQVKWGLNYIKDRYKTPTEAWKFWQKHKSY